MKHFGPPPSVEELDSIAREAFAAIPKALRVHAKDVVIRVQDFPDEEILEELDCESAFDLLGLYQGVDLTRKSVSDTPQQPDMVYLYRRPILDYWCDSEEDLTHVVRHVLIHEIGHHFGYSDDDMEAIEDAAR
ncbi:MAG: metallopeptidase family protein [Kiloniellales bacterium]|nr:metallopeptidase family protein [Kiloniellales bacterium]MDJ0969652.1 metallopeptidase family protein [Kiloniellales bacterium]MDJ0983717.1 metallopeptidase family protein [Kiloniellales bacterium]